ncbi:ATP-binding protein [Tropicimonas sp. IMCC34043]|uniref:ATP-binding protein n=1 Tax=Tropicimonas sp. IMCC34043 TaxID=2248760 RepID=UPI0018E510ED|nr:ATP-binding protein [Tropicimonas sp. IMCC34043]
MQYVRPKTATRPRLALAALTALGLILAGLFGYATLSRQYRSELVEKGNESLALSAEMVRSWLDRYRVLAPIYAHDPRLAAALWDPTDPDAIAALNSELEIWNAAAGTADTYVMDAAGTTIAASNWSDPDSFVGQNFAFRPYFEDAIGGQLGRFFGLGTTSGERGYYFAAPVRGEAGTLGVVAVKVPVTGMEQDLRLGTNQVFVSDRAGVVILSGNPVLRLTALGEIPNGDRDRIEQTRQFDLTRITPVPITAAGSWLRGAHPVVSAPADRSGERRGEFLHLTRPMLAEGWTLHMLVDIAPIRTQLTSAAFVAAAGVLTVAALLALLGQRRRRLMERLHDRERAQLLLERRVAERTADLSAANLRLLDEVAERKAAEASLRQAQAELVQAGKLAALGQMSAALSHEFNQPLTAVRTYSENAIAFIEAGSGDKARENLARVLRLTERMAQLSKHLIRFARRSDGKVDPVALSDAFAETLTLLQGRIERAEAEVAITGAEGVRVLGGQVRLQHVFMNLVGNTLDAVPPDTRPRIDIAVTADGDRVSITFDDNGPGIPPDVLPRIFDPFFTTKDVGKGLGLGLSISFNIVTDFGGTMRAENRTEGGARFVIVLRKADAGAREAAE